MPDWTYGPLLKPLGVRIFRDNAGNVALESLRALSSVAPGRWIIRFMGHMSTPTELAVSKNGISLTGPVMIGAKLDENGIAQRAFAQFEVGAIAVGPNANGRNHRDNSVRMVRSVGNHLSRADIAFCSLEEACDFNQPNDESNKQALLVELPSTIEDSAALEQVKRFAQRNATGFVINSETLSNAVEQTKSVRNLLGANALVVARGDVRSPRDAMHLYDAGADVVCIDDGIADAGPGLAKRIDAVLLARRRFNKNNNASWSNVSVASVLFGLCILGAAAVATYVALTTVILGYDEAFVHLNHTQMSNLNPHLLHFMRHDRLSYAGGTASIGFTLTALAFFGARKREEWAVATFRTLGVACYVTAGLFLLFHYFDYGNISVAILMFPFFAPVLFARINTVHSSNALDLDNDSVWKRGLIGQLLLVTTGVGLILGGISICVVGATNVFVISDLDYLHTTAEYLKRANERLLPLVAHDRVSFGGVEACNGIAYLFIGMWGYARGARWVWWTVLISGGTNLGFTFYAHLSTNYTEIGHMAPVFLGAIFFVAALIFSRSYLCDTSEKLNRS